MPLCSYMGKEYTGDTWAMANMNMIIHDMEGKIEIGDSFRSLLSNYLGLAEKS